MTTSEIRRHSSRLNDSGKGVVWWCGLLLALRLVGERGEVDVMGERGAEGEGRLENSTMAIRCQWTAPSPMRKRAGFDNSVAVWASRLLADLQSRSTLRTRAPSFASRAASGRPTTSDLHVSACASFIFAASYAKRCGVRTASLNII